MEDVPEKLWNRFKEFSGLTEEECFEYFGDREKGVAIEIRDVEEFPEPLDPKMAHPRFTPPQSWIYLPAGEQYTLQHFGEIYAQE